jgi:hypothetical protein
MRQIFVTKSTVDYGLSTSTGDIAGMNELDKLENGALVCLDADGAFVDDANPAITTSGIYFALGRTGLPPVISPLIDIASLNYEKSAYVAPVAKIMVLGTNVSGETTYGLNLPSSFTVGTEAGIHIVDASKSHGDTSRYHDFTTNVRSGETATTLMARLLALVNADNFVTMASIEAGKGYSLTADTAGKEFSVNCSGILEYADVLGYKEVVYAGTAGVASGDTQGLTTVVRANVFGVGTYAEIAALEADYSTEMGNTGLQQRGVALYTGSFGAVSGGTYTTYKLTWQAPGHNVLMPENNPIQLLVIAIPSGETGAGEDCTAMDNILASL